MKTASQVFRRAAHLVRPFAALLLVSAPLIAPTQASGQSLATGAAVAISRLKAADTGVVPASQPVHLTLSLKLDAARSTALDALLAGLIDSSSRSFHQWLTPQQFAASYGASSAQIAAASTWAQAHGFSVDAVSAGGTALRVTGTSSQVQATFGIPLHTYQAQGSPYYANQADPTLDASAATLFSAVAGLDDLPAPAAFNAAALNRQGHTASSLADAVSSLLDIVDGNATSILTIDSALCSSALTPSQIDQFRSLLKQASAQGITVLASSGCGPQGSGSFPASLPEVTSVASPSAQAAALTPLAARPSWQVAPGLPLDSLRYEPDLTASSLAALTQTLASIVQQAGDRQGNVGANLYKLAPIPGLYTQPDAVPAGTWEAATGLGLVDLAQLTKVYPRGTVSSYTSFGASNYSPTHGQSTTLTSTVTSGNGGAAPTGTVSFVTSTGTTLGTAALVNGSTTPGFTTNTLPGGNYIVKAVYSGDTSYGPSSSPTGQITVQPEPSSLSASISGSVIVGYPVNVVVTDTASSGVGQPSGTVTVSLPGSGANYTATLVGTSANSASATVTFPTPAVGTITLSINCTTSASYSCYNPYTTTVTIVKATPTLNISYTPNPPVSGASITLNASLSTSGSAPSPTGSVVFYDNGTILNSAQIANGVGSTTASVPTTATHSITATYNGDPNYNTVSTNAGTTSGGPTVTTTALASSASTVVAGQTITFTATVTPGGTGVSPTGTVQFFDGSTLLGTGSLAGANATLATSSLSPFASHSIVAIYTGDTNDSGSTSNTVSVAKSSTPVATSTALTVGSTTATFGTAVMLSATVTPTVSNIAPTGTVQFLSGSTALCTGTLTSSAASCSTTTLPVGTDSITANYLGDTNYAASTSAAGSIAITAAVAVNSTLVASISPAISVLPGATATITAILNAPVGIVPSGAITATITGVAGASYSVTLPGTPNTSTLTVTIPIVTPSVAGTYSVVVACAGSNFSCNPVTLSLVASTTAKIATTTVLTTSAAAVGSGSAITLTATVTAASTGAAAVSGTVIFYNGTAAIATGTIANGVATASATIAGISNSLTAVYSGDTSYASSTSAPVVVTSAATPAGVTLASNVTKSLVGYDVVLTAQVVGSLTAGSGTSAATPTGKVFFYDTFNGVITLLGSATVSSSGGNLAVAGLSSTGLLEGTHLIDAVYSGDANYTTATSATITVSETDYSLTALYPASLTLPQGATGTVFFLVNFLGGFSGDVNLSCTAPAGSGIACTFSNPIVPSNGGPTTLTVTTTASHAMFAPRPGLWQAAGGVFCAILAGFLLPRRRRALPTLFALALTLVLLSNLGCGGTDLRNTPGAGTTSGSPLGTANLTINTSGNDGVTSISHTYTYTVNIQ
jgi:hypothetical protein